MRILQVIDTLKVGGAEKVCINLISMLLDAGHQADCLVISAEGSLFEKIDKRSKVFFLNRKSKFNLFTMRKCALIASGYDIVHVHMRHTWVYVRLSSLLYNRRIKLVFHDHFWEIVNSRDVSFRLKGIFRPAYYIGVSSDHVKWAKKYLNIREERIYLLSNIILPKYEISTAYSGDLLMISSLREIKNVLFGIELANTLKRKLTIFGNPDGSKYSHRVLDSAKESDFVQIIQNDTDVQQYIENFSLAIHTAHAETGPLVLLEYLAHGLPFVTFDTGEVVNQIRNDLPDFIASTFDTEEWTRKIDLLENEIKYNGETIKAKLQDLFKTKFSLENYTAKCLKIYQNVLGYS